MSAFVAVAEAKEAIAVLRGHLAVLDEDTSRLYDACAAFDHDAVLELALKSERVVEAVKAAEADVVPAVKAVKAAGVADAIAADLDGVVAVAAVVRDKRARTKVMVEKAKQFIAAHQRAVLPPTTATAYGRGARAVVGTRLTSMRSIG